MHLQGRNIAHRRGHSVITPQFVVAVLLLGAAAILASPIAGSIGFSQVKDALPLKKPLGMLNAEALEPYRVVKRQVLEAAMVEGLGTDKYVSWVLEDGSVGRNDPLRFATLFVTYYSGGTNLVPHTPDVCALGAGYQPAQAHESMRIDASRISPELSSLPVRVCTFMKTAVHHRSKHTVVYTFHCNGELVAGRTGVRSLINTPGNKYAYFSKVEVSFHGATRAQAVEAAGKLLGSVLPVLIRDHFPDFERAERSARKENSPAGGPEGGGE